jgi:hypothetical protein
VQRGTTHHHLFAGAAAATTLVLCVGTATPALAGQKPHKVVKDPLASVRAKGHAGATSTVLTSDEQIALHDAGVYAGIALRDDRVAVMRATTKKTIANVVAAASRSVAVSGLQLTVITAAETHLAAGNAISDAIATLTDEATTAAANGDDTTDVTDALAAVSVDLESAQGDASTAVTDVMGLSATATAADLKSALGARGDDLATIDQDIADATDDLAAAQSSYDELISGDGGDPGDG